VIEGESGRSSKILHTPRLMRNGNRSRKIVDYAAALHRLTAPESGPLKTEFTPTSK
jgi:hypothetical protein